MFPHHKRWVTWCVSSYEWNPVRFLDFSAPSPPPSSSALRKRGTGTGTARCSPAGVKPGTIESLPNASPLGAKTFAGWAPFVCTISSAPFASEAPPPGTTSPPARSRAAGLLRLLMPSASSLVVSSGVDVAGGGIGAGRPATKGTGRSSQDRTSRLTLWSSGNRGCRQKRKRGLC